MLVWLLSTAAAPTPAPAQVDSASLHATLSGWSESNWLPYLNRDGAIGGRLSSLGILQRFQEDLDFEYQLDRLTASFALTEDYEWYELHKNGIRWQGGSITKQDLFVGTQFKTVIPIGKSWNAGIRFDQEVNPTTDRNLLRFGFDKSWDSGVFAFAGASLDPLKPDSDVELGVGWRSEAAPNPRQEARLTVAVIDWTNNLIYLGLDAGRQPQVDSTLAYRGQPLAFRGSVSSRVGTAVRWEAFGAVATPSTIDQYEGAEQDLGIRQAEEYGFIGGLLEWSARPELRIGGFATHIRAQTERTALSAGLDVDEYRLMEATTNIGAFALLRMGASWHLEAFLVRNWRPEKREFRNSTSPDVDYLDRAWTGQVLARRTAGRGFLADVGLVWDVRDVIRGEGEVPSSGRLGWHNYRVTAMVGWRFNPNMMFLVGAGLDLDGDDSGKNRFDGLRGRFTAVW